MRKNLIISFLFILSLSMMAQSNTGTYRTKWIKVDNYEAQKLPASATEEVNKILKQAIAENNTQQIVKAFIHKKKYSNQIESSDASELIASLIDLEKKSKSVSDKALLNSMIAELYSNSYEYHYRSVRNRTDILGDVPENMAEWTNNIFINKIIQHAHSALKEKEILVNESISKYPELIMKEEGLDAIPDPSLYDFLAQRNINLAQALALRNQYAENLEKSTGLSLEQLASDADSYTKLSINKDSNPSNFAFSQIQEYMLSLQKREMTAPLIFLELSKLEILNEISQDIKYESLLRGLLSKYNNHEASIEIRHALVNAIENDANYDRVVLRDFMGSEYEEAADTNTEEIYQICTEGKKLYPNYRRIALMDRVLARIENPFLSTRFSDSYRTLYHPSEDISINYSFKNIQAVKSHAKFVLAKMDNDKPVLVNEFTPSLKTAKAYIQESGKLELGKLDFGDYRLLYIQSDNEMQSFRSQAEDAIKLNNYIGFTVSQLASYYKANSKEEYELFVVDRKTGRPIENAQILVKQRSDNKELESISKTYSTDKMGRASIQVSPDKKYKLPSVKIKLENDIYLKEILLYNHYNYRSSSSSNEPSTHINIFTDRNIYRPGQIVYFKALVFSENEVIPNKSVEVEFYDANSELLASKTLKTNEFGSVAGEFILPKSVLTGSFRIEVEDQTYYLTVEEYKRPTFEISFDKVKETYKFGEEVSVKGKALTYSGIKLQNATVSYSINRRGTFMPFMAYDSFFESGELSTDENGEFTIKFVPKEPDQKHPWAWRNTSSFQINADITDLNGETQSDFHSIVVGEVSMYIDINLSEQLEKSTIQDVKISAYNLSREEITTSGKYQIYSLSSKDSIQHLVLELDFKSGIQPELMAKLKELETGKYRIQLQALDNKQNEVKNEKDFLIYSFDDKQPPADAESWLAQKKTKFSSDSPAEIIVGSSLKDVYTHYLVYNSEKIFIREFVKLNNSNEKLKIEYKEEYGDGVYLSLLNMRNGNFDNTDILLTKDTETKDKKLNVKLDVFRDKLRPGQKETWTLSVKDSEGKGIIAEILASMYDKSLDQLADPQQWGIDTPYKYDNLQSIYYQIASFDYGAHQVMNVQLKGWEPKIIDLADDNYSYLNWFGYYSNTAVSSGLLGMQAGHSKSISIRGIMPGLRIKNGESVHLKEFTVAEDLAVAGMGRNYQEAPQPQVRENFNETAFFYPQLRTNKDGETLIEFTIPESNTKWSFKILAHDKQLRNALVEKEVITQKELMITPNMPRFIRHGDKTSISTKISNLSEQAISGNVKIKFFDPITNAPIKLNLKNQEQSFSLAPDASGSASWTFDVPTDMEIIACRILAQSENFSDGEQHALPVLANRMLVTEAMPFDITKEGTSQFKFDSFANNNSKTLDNYQLTLEYANNPAWYAVMAMPSLSTPQHDNATNWLASYYVNAISSSLINHNPKIAAMIKAWKLQGETKETLVSKLSQNEELKNIILEESPWVADAKNEEEMMARLAIFFDINNSQEQTKLAISKLEELQLGDGGWSWFMGFKSNRFMTQYVLHSLNKLQLIGQVELPESVKMMQMRALKFIDKVIVDDYNALKKGNKDWEKLSGINSQQLEYLYTRSFYRDVNPSHETREAERFYTSVASKNWTKLNLYEQALLAVLLKRNSETVLAEQITKSLREYSKTDAKMGMYWPNNKMSRYNSLSNVSLHTYLMEALRENGASKEELDLMKQWLLKQKQAKVWESTHATVNAIAILLQDGSDWFAADDKQASIELGNKSMNTKDSQLGTGYIKTSWSKTELSKNMAQITVDKFNDVPAYGALYWQYFEDLDKISNKKSDLNIEKTLYKKEYSNQGAQLIPVTENNPIYIGDEIVMRLSISSTRDLDFVQIKDMRAACFEPVDVKSGVHYAGNISYYQATKDASSNFFIERLAKGSYVIEYSVRANRAGEYANGITSIESSYIPEYTSHTAGIKVTVREKE